MRARFGSMPRTQCSSNESAAVGEEADRLEHVVDDERLEDVQLEVARGPADVDGDVVPEDLGRRPSSAPRDCVGFTLPGMIELPGSFSGMVISPRPERGPDASQRTSLAIFIEAAARVLSAPCGRHERVVRGERLRTCSGP